MKSRKSSPAKLNTPLRRWAKGDLDLTMELGSVTLPKEEPVFPYEPTPHREMVTGVLQFSRMLYRDLVGFLGIIIATVLLLTVANLPASGDANSPTVNEVAERYVEQGTEETGAVNTVAGMILDYRAFDTLGESFVLFTAMCTVSILMTHIGRNKRRIVEKEAVDYYTDPIVRTVCKLVIPIILLFGVYILLNGHLSPGGGFSGGAILASGMIMFAMVWGDERAHEVFRPAIIRRIVLCALCFYALSKAYSFFTGANHLHSIISPGTPGRILSGGLILPLNVAVGFVVGCTMYSFYMFFRREEL